VAPTLVGDRVVNRAIARRFPNGSGCPPDGASQNPAHLATIGQATDYPAHGQPEAFPPDLADVVTARPHLPPDVRNMILGVVKLTPKASPPAAAGVRR